MPIPNGTHLRRFYAPDAGLSAGTVSLDDEQSDHLRTVLRMREGEKVSVFDGLGKEFLGEIEEIQKRGVSLQILSEIDPSSPESPLRLTLASALLKSDKFEIVIQKAVELGVDSLVPLISQRCEIDPVRAEKRYQRWRKIIIESSKQCGRAKLLDLAPVTDFPVLAEAIGEPAVFFTERDGDRLPILRNVSEVTAFTGPEGGWDDLEIELARNLGFHCVTLGGRTLRAETAAIVLTGILQHRFGDIR